MTWGAVGGAAISVAGGLLGSKNKGMGKAIRAQENAAAKAQIAQQNVYRDAKEQLSPYSTAGGNASKKLAELLGIADPEGYAPKPTRDQFWNQLEAEHYKKYKQGYDAGSDMGGVNAAVDSMYQRALSEWEKGKAEYLKANPADQSKATLLKNFTNEDFVKDPGYEFRQAEGNKALERSAAARGGLYSGAALKALDRYNQDYASNEFNNAFNRDAANKARTFSFLSGTAGQGLQAAGALVGAGQNAANQTSNALQNAGNNTSSLYSQNGQWQADNQSNMFQSAIANGLYAYERNKPVTGTSTVPSGGFSGGTPPYVASASKPWYLS
jgi:hypothetical protein